MLCCAVGSFAIGNNMSGVVTVASFGIIGYVMEENGYPVAAMVLGIVMGTMVEQAFVTSLIKSDGSILPFGSNSHPVSLGQIIFNFTKGIQHCRTIYVFCLAIDRP